MTEQQPSNNDHRVDITPEGLTCIRECIHCTPTPECNNAENEKDQIIVENFLDTLAEIAMAIASRRKVE